MARSRADDILNAWRAAAHSATRPALAPRSARIQPAVPFGILVAAAVVLVLLVAHGPRGLVTGPAASFPAGGAPAAVPSANLCIASPNAGTHLVTVEQEPMRPTLLAGDVVSVTGLAAADLRRGDVVAIDPSTWLKGAAPFPFVMRIVALGGDQVAIRDGHVFVDGAQLDEPYVFAGEPTVVQSGAAASWQIPADGLFVLGDNRSSAADSRAYGPLPAAAIIGRVTYRCEPVGRRGPIASTAQLSSASPSP
jgi:signal peptidase I